MIEAENYYEKYPETLIPLIARQQAILWPQETLGHAVLYMIQDARLAQLLMLDRAIVIVTDMDELQRALGNIAAYTILIPVGSAITPTFLRRELASVTTKKAIFFITGA